MKLTIVLPPSFTGSTKGLLALDFPEDSELATHPLNFTGDSVIVEITLESLKLINGGFIKVVSASDGAEILKFKAPAFDSPSAGIPRDCR